MKSASRLLRAGLGLAVLAGIVVAVVVLPVREWALELFGGIRAAGPVGIVIYAGVYVLFALFMLPGSIMSVAAGFLWGPVWGVALNVTLAALAGIAPFYLGRFVARGWVRRRTAQYPKWAAIDAAVETQGFKVVLLLRLSLAPYNFLNYALGLTRVRLLDFVLGTWLGMIPAVSVLAYFGSLITDAAQLGSAVHGSRLLYWGGFVTTTVGIVLLVRIARRALARALTPAARTDPT